MRAQETVDWLMTTLDVYLDNLTLELAISFKVTCESFPVWMQLSCQVCVVIVTLYGHTVMVT